ncbi:hypothetical protein SNE40_017679 [Patella caerulea]|uniref:G-protein coupled receptors family 1 profile domain-containing protein n=1 Tax=Patella caerulea TaxID=87958 RepID=A0AAN8JFF3_PATCE
MYSTTDQNITFLSTEPVDADIPLESEIRNARILLLLPRFIFLFVILVVGTTGNVLVLYIYHFKSKLSTFTLFVQVLALLDLLNCFTSVPGALALVIGQDHVDMDILCTVMPFLSLYTAIASGVLFTIIAYQRYYGISKPMVILFELPLAKKLCLFSILIAVVPSILRLFLDYGLRSEVSFNDLKFNITMCVVTDEARQSTLYFIYQAVLAILFFGIFVTLSVLYILMWRQMIRSNQKRAQLCQDQPESSQPNCNTHVNTFKIFFAITVVFILSYLPHLVIVTFRHLDSNLSPVRRAFYDLGYYSPLWNNAANPLVYSFFSADFRCKCKQVLCCEPPPQQPGVSFRKTSRMTSVDQSTV